MIDSPPLSKPAASQGRIIALGLVGAVIGGIAGFYLFMWIARQGLYALLVPPVLLGLGATLLARGRSMILASLCGLGGLGLGIFTEWSFAPFSADPSFGYFITHLQHLRPITLIMLALGAVASLRIGLGWTVKRN